MSASDGSASPLPPFFVNASSARFVLVPTAADRFELVVRRSFADYFFRIMIDAATPLMR